MTDCDDQIRKARARLFRYLAYRARTSSEAASYLQKLGFANGEASAAIKDLQEMGYLNDKVFTGDFISYRKARYYGPRRIRHELLNKGLDRSTVEELLAADEDVQEELQTIRVLLNKRVSANKDADQRWFVRQADYLRRRGFRDRQIMTALKEYGFGEEQL